VGNAWCNTWHLADGMIRLYSNADSVVAIRPDGTLAETPLSRPYPRYVPWSNCPEPISLVASTFRAFAAVTCRGRVVTFGDADFGADSSAVAMQISHGVTNVRGTSGAFAALKQDGSVVAWGDPLCGGDSSNIASLLISDVVSIAANSESFAAIKEGGMLLPGVVLCLVVIRQL